MVGRWNLLSGWPIFCVLSGVPIWAGSPFSGAMFVSARVIDLNSSRQKLPGFSGKSRIQQPPRGSSHYLPMSAWTLSRLGKKVLRRGKFQWICVATMEPSLVFSVSLGLLKGLKGVFGGFSDFPKSCPVWSILHIRDHDETFRIFSGWGLLKGVQISHIFFRCWVVSTNFSVLAPFLVKQIKVITINLRILP